MSYAPVLLPQLNHSLALESPPHVTDPRRRVTPMSPETGPQGGVPGRGSSAERAASVLAALERSEADFNARYALFVCVCFY
jgi:hypothetical protein